MHPAMNQTATQLHDLAEQRPEIACKRITASSTPYVLETLCYQIEAIYGFFSDDLWASIKKEFVLPSQVNEMTAHYENLAVKIEKHICRAKFGPNGKTTFKEKP